MSRSIRSGPTTETAIEHWQKVLANKNLSWFSHECAREAINVLLNNGVRGIPPKERNPGEDDK